MSEAFKIFMNPRAGRAADGERDALVAAFTEAGAAPEIITVPSPQLDAAVRGVAGSERLIGVAGGDGTISGAAHALARSATALLPIPLGTLNHFSNRYGIPSVEAAAYAWRRAHVHAVHVGVVNDRSFVNNASCGFYPHVVRHRERIERVLPRLPAIWLAGMRVLIELPMMRLELGIAARRTYLKTPALWVGIGRNSLRLPTPGDSAVQGDVLEIVTGRAETRRAVVALSCRLLHHLRRGLEPQADNLAVERVASFTLHSRHAIDIALDGEPFQMRGPLHFSLKKDALRVVCLVAPSA